MARRELEIVTGIAIRKSHVGKDILVHKAKLTISGDGRIEEIHPFPMAQVFALGAFVEEADDAKQYQRDSIEGQ
jgi:hypothetical protein